MCFLLYAGTSKPLPKREWNSSDPHVNVQDLEHSESWVRTTFSKPVVQNIGSSTHCGCAFPSVMQDGAGEWYYWLDPVKDAEEIASNKRECEELCDLLAQADEDQVELYGVWAGNEDKQPLIRESIALDEIRREFFRFKEGGYYRVKLR
jgi:hypothetical protein